MLNATRRRYDALKETVTSEVEGSREASSLVQLSDSVHTVKCEESIGVINQSVQLSKSGVITWQSIQGTLRS